MSAARWHGHRPDELGVDRQRFSGLKSLLAGFTPDPQQEREDLMTTAREKMEQAKERIATNADRLKAIGAVYKFVLEGDGGGTWIADFRDNPSIHEGDGDADCTITMAAEQYVDMLEGRATPEALFFTQKLKVDGDMNLAVRLGDIADIMK